MLRAVAGVARPFRSNPRARGPHRPAAEPTTSADLVGQTLARLGGSGRAREFRVFECYARVVGAAFRACTRPERLAGTTLFVRVGSSALAHELTLLRAEVLARMAAELGPDTVTELRTRTGPIPHDP
jgi:predicted nucleic acid-binding Zn ribbon protein